MSLQSYFVYLLLVLLFDEIDKGKWPFIPKHSGIVQF